MPPIRGSGEAAARGDATGAAAFATGEGDAVFVAGCGDGDLVAGPGEAPEGAAVVGAVAGLAGAVA
ncbi:MAG TPA: hypothetical protein VHL09_14710 [Dehalococcoidia bacterium]|nr:hypothetical protein [Dehalococcoidia bacterium]